MPYFIICPIYAVLFVGLILISLALLFIKELRHWSSYVACGAVGTIPGFILGNILFWVIALGVLQIFQKPMQQITSDIAVGAATITVIIFFIGGLAIANIAGCAVGFVGGLWIRHKFRRKNTGQHESFSEPPKNQKLPA
jgi:hypothetical protein